MLMKIDERTKRLLDLADFIEKEKTFYQGNWTTCICGKAQKMLGAEYGGNAACQTEWACEALQINADEARELFSNYGNPRQEDACRVIRHFALTGQVDWRKASNYSWLWGTYKEQRTNGQVDSEVLPRNEPVPVSVA